MSKCIFSILKTLPPKYSVLGCLVKSYVTETAQLQDKEIQDRVKAIEMVLNFLFYW